MINLERVELINNLRMKYELKKHIQIVLINWILYKYDTIAFELYISNYLDIKSSIAFHITPIFV